MITANRLRQLLDYDADTGVFTWREPRGVRSHSVAGSIDNHGYRKIKINGRCYKAHRLLAWPHVHGEWPSGEIDHANGNKADNPIRNLRIAIATPSQNNWNRAPTSRNSTGFKGVQRSGGGKFRALATVDGKQVYLGRYATAELAQEADNATAKLHGYFARPE